MDVNYIVKGEPGKTCADCKLYEDKGNGTGDCYGHEVLSEGSCNLFNPNINRRFKQSWQMEISCGYFNTTKRIFNYLD